MNTNEDDTVQRSEQQLPLVSSQACNASCNVHKSETNDVGKALPADGNKQYLEKIGGEKKTNTDTLIKFPCQYKPYMYLL